MDIYPHALTRTHEGILSKRGDKVTKSDNPLMGLVWTVTFRRHFAVFGQVTVALFGAGRLVRGGKPLA